MASHCRLVMSLMEERLRRVLPDTSLLAWVQRGFGGKEGELDAL